MAFTLLSLREARRRVRGIACALVPCFDCPDLPHGRTGGADRGRARFFPRTSRMLTATVQGAGDADPR